MTRRTLPAVLLALTLAAGCGWRDPTTRPTVPPTTVTAPPASGEPVCPQTALAGCATVVRVVDGDTLVAKLDGRAAPDTVRLIGVDTPETKHPGQPVGCYGPEASAATARLAPPGTRVGVGFDAEVRDRTPSRRLLAYVYLPSGRMLNAELVWSGYARAKAFKPNTRYRAVLEARQAQAKAARRGLWSHCEGQP